MEPHVTNEQLLESLIRWKGNIKAISEILRMRRKNVYERVERLQAAGLALPLATYRTSGASVSFFDRGKNMSRAERVMPRDTQARGDVTRGGSSGSKVSVVPVTAAATPPIVSGMESVAEEFPIRTVQPKARTLRITDENQAALRSARRRLEAAFGVETDENLLLNQILEETTERWVQEKEALAKPTPEKKARKREPQP